MCSPNKICLAIKRLAIKPQPYLFGFHLVTFILMILDLAVTGAVTKD